MTEAMTKGIGFVNARAFVEERFGGNAWADVLAQLVPADRQALEGIVPVGWYSLALYARLIRAIDAVHGYGDLSLVVQLGRFEAERDLTTIHRIFLRLANPAFILEKTAEYWRRFHDTGHWVVDRKSDTRVVAYLDDWGHVDVALCREVVGYVSRLFELVGAKNVRMDHARCRARGDARCEFLGRWGESASADSARRDAGTVGSAGAAHAPSAPNVLGAAARRDDARAATGARRAEVRSGALPVGAGGRERDEPPAATATGTSSSESKIASGR